MQHRDHGRVLRPPRPPAWESFCVLVQTWTTILQIIEKMGQARFS